MPHHRNTSEPLNLPGSIIRVPYANDMRARTFGDLGRHPDTSKLHSSIANRCAPVATDQVIAQVCLVLSRALPLRGFRAGGMIRGSAEECGAVGGIELPYAGGVTVIGGVDGLD